MYGCYKEKLQSLLEVNGVKRTHASMHFSQRVGKAAPSVRVWPGCCLYRPPFKPASSRTRSACLNMANIAYKESLL